GILIGADDEVVRLVQLDAFEDVLPDVAEVELEAGKAVRDRRGWQRARRVARRAIRQLLVEPGRDDLLRRERPLHRLNGERDCGGAVLRARSAAHRGSFSDCGVVGMVKVTASGSSAVALRLPEARMA